MARFYNLESSFINSISFDTNGDVLTVIFSSGKESTYRGVPHWKFIGLLNADAPGQYYDNEIKGQYSGTNE